MQASSAGAEWLKALNNVIWLQALNNAKLITYDISCECQERKKPREKLSVFIGNSYVYNLIYKLFMYYCLQIVITRQFLCHIYILYYVHCMK